MSRNWRRWGKKVAATPAVYEVHFGDETHVDTNPCLYRVWHRRGQQAITPAAGTNRRLSVIGSITTTGHDGIAVLTDRADSAAFGRYLAALDVRHEITGHRIILVLDNGSCHTSKLTRAAIADRAAWLEVIFLSRYSPELNPIERAWNRLKREHRTHLAPSLPTLVTEVLAGLRALGGNPCDIVNAVPQWWLDGHKRPPTGRKAGRPVGARDTHPRKPRSQNLPAST